MTSAGASACSGEVGTGAPKRTCANERVRAANRANAARSTGPRTRAGKAAVARNALRHGLSLPVLADPALAAEVAALAARIAGPGADPVHHSAAVRVAEAQVDVLRVRRVRDQVMAEGFAAADPTARLMRLDRYERRALSRRKAAIKAFDALNGAVAPRRRRDPWAAVAAAARLRGFWQNKPDVCSAGRKGASIPSAARLRGLGRTNPISAPPGAKAPSRPPKGRADFGRTNPISSQRGVNAPPVRLPLARAGASTRGNGLLSARTNATGLPPACPAARLAKHPDLPGLPEVERTSAPVALGRRALQVHARLCRPFRGGTRPRAPPDSLPHPLQYGSMRTRTKAGESAAPAQRPAPSDAAPVAA